jgi:hypothetical protein
MALVSILQEMGKIKKDNRGGPGRGQGRKKGTKVVPYETVTMRIPVPLVKSIHKQIKDFKLSTKRKALVK